MTPPAPAVPPADDDAAAALLPVLVGATEAASEPPPAITPKTRTAVYVLLLTLDVLIVLGFGLAAIFGWLPSQQAAAAMTLALAAMNAISSGLGVAYRPTRPGAARSIDPGAVLAAIAALTSSGRAQPAGLLRRLRR